LNPRPVHRNSNALPVAPPRHLHRDKKLKLELQFIKNIVIVIKYLKLSPYTTQTANNYFITGLLSTFL